MSIVAIAFCAAGCGPRPSPSSSLQGAAGASGGAIVVATIYPLYDWARVVGGERVTAHCLVRAGMSPHTYEPAPEDAQALARARLLLMVGKGLEPWAEGLKAAAPGLRTLALGEGLAQGQEHRASGGEHEAHFSGSVPGLRDAHEHGDHPGDDPHVWLDPVFAQAMVERLGAALAEVDRTDAQGYIRRAAEYSAQLERLDAELARLLAPFRGRSVVTFHNAWGHFLSRYGLRLAATIAESPGKEPSAKYLQGLISWMRDNGVRTVFAEPQFSPKAARIIAEEVGGQVVLLDPIGDENDPRRDSYLKLMRFNAEALAEALRASSDPT